MKLKKGDKVIVIAGKSKGSTGSITRVLVQENQVIIDGVNIVKRHRRATQQSRSGQIVNKAMPVHASNVMIVDPKSGKGSRITIKRDAQGVRSRVAVQSGTDLK